MRKHFEDWFKVRANLPVNEGPMDWLAAGAAKMGFPGWQKDRQRTQQDPRNSANLPVNYDALVNSTQWHSNLDNFINVLGLDVKKIKYPTPLWDSISRIAAARIYGPKIAIIEQPDLARVWAAVSKNPAKMAKLGITRPLSIPYMVPGADPNQRYTIRQAASEWDAAVAQMQSDQSNQQSPQPAQGPSGTPKPGQPVPIPGQGQGPSPGQGQPNPNLAKILSDPRAKTQLQALLKTLKGPQNKNLRRIINQLLSSMP